MKVEISKTLFKEYSKCKDFYILNNIYTKKSLSEYTDELKNKYLSLMFDELGEDLICCNNKKIDILQDYYKDVERVSLKIASKTFDKTFVYKENNKDQKLIKYIDSNGYTFYTYLDGYYEDEKEIYIVEAKATTCNAFLKMGYKTKGEFIPLFKKNNNIISLASSLNNGKSSDVYQKLFDKYDSCGKYIYDIAITSFIMRGFLKQNNINKRVNYYLAVLNSDYEYDGFSDYDVCNGEEVICFIDVCKILNDYESMMDLEYFKIINNIINKNIECKYSKACKDECMYQKVCHPFLKEKDNIETLLIPKAIKLQGKRLDTIDMINLGYKNVCDIPFEYIVNENHRIQRDAIDKGIVYFDKEKIKTMLDKNIIYPIYHLDFEAFQSPLPRFFKEKPYMQSVFQYSIHIQKDKMSCDEFADNYYFLPNDFLDHREELIVNMIKTIDLSNGGTVLVYNKSFEYTRIKEFMYIYPKYKKELQLILDHMFDLLDIIKKDSESKSLNFYHKNLHGSYSIKKVLPVFTNISYDDLEVRNGVEAQMAYAEFKKMPYEDIEILRESLIRYCRQDTYSMYKILCELYKKSQE